MMTKKYIIFLLIIFNIAFARDSAAQGEIYNDYLIQLNKLRGLKNAEFSDTLTSPLSKIDISQFTGLYYFPPDSTFRVMAKFTEDTLKTIFKMVTTTDRLPDYIVFGFLDFILNDTSCRLTVYQNLKNKIDKQEEFYLFVPFRDATNDRTTYGAGRYLDIIITGNDSIQIDLNTAYNPYCAYNKRWSCPLVPVENWLKISILAGEKKYK